MSNSTFILNEGDFTVLKAAIKKILPGVSWRNPVINFVFKCIDPIDYLARSINGNSRIPPYSIRVRSAGVHKQLGGKEFLSVGRTIAALLTKHAGLTGNSTALEIGCGSGRTAFVLAETLKNGHFYGMDIEKVALSACNSNKFLNEKNFKFELMDVQNDEYNPDGTFQASNFKFPYDDGKFDVIYLVSVFTHMMTEDVKNYIAEISRLLRPGGSVMITTFLLENLNTKDLAQFPHRIDSAYCREKTMPEIAVAYTSEFYNAEFDKHNLSKTTTLNGHWRGYEINGQPSSLLQDVVVYKKG